MKNNIVMIEIGPYVESKFADVLKFFTAYGFTLDSGKYNPEEYASKYGAKYYNIKLNLPKRNVYAGNYVVDVDVTYEWPKDMLKLYQLITKRSITVEGVGEYTATVTKDSVTVGCQTISREKVMEIAKALESLQ